jgi:hypothetical protein
MKSFTRFTISLVLLQLAAGLQAWAQSTSPGTDRSPQRIASPDKVQTSLDTPAYKDFAWGAEPLTLTPKYLDQEAATKSPDAGEGDVNDSDSTKLAKKLANPVANLISIPFQFNYATGIGPKDASSVVLNVQPVIPISLNNEWNLIVRTIVPVVYVDSIADGVSSKFGLGDTTQSFFFSPKAPTKGGWIWGVGPVFLWPTATNDELGSGKWGAGPTAVVLRQEHGFTYGMLANQIWSYADKNGESRAAVNKTFLQPFLTYTFPTATSIGINTESTYDWTAHEWTVPITAFASQLMKVGKLPVQFEVGATYYAQSPAGGPEGWGARFQMTLLLPK